MVCLINDRDSSPIPGLRNLDSLILAHNKLTKVPANVFSHLTLLNSLELEGNNIAYIDENAFAGLEGGCRANGPQGIKIPHKHLTLPFACRESPIFAIGR